MSYHIKKILHDYSELTYKYICRILQSFIDRKICILLIVMYFCNLLSANFVDK